MTPKKLTFILSGFIAALMLVGLYGFWMGHQALDEKADELSRTMADTSLVNEQLTSLQRLERQYEDIQPLEDKVYEVLPRDKQQTEVTLQLNQIVNNAGLQLRGLTFESTSGRPGEQSQTLSSSVPGVLVMPVRFQISSQYEEFVELLQTIENQQRYMQVSNLSISRTGEQLQFSVNLEVFLRP